jgi:hypothetical protein
MANTISKSNLPFATYSPIPRSVREVDDAPLKAETFAECRLRTPDLEIGLKVDWRPGGVSNFATQIKYSGHHQEVSIRKQPL